MLNLEAERERDAEKRKEQQFITSPDVVLGLGFVVFLLLTQLIVVFPSTDSINILPDH